MAITTNLQMSNGTDLGNNLFAGNGTSNGNQTFNIIQANGVDLGKGWYNKSSCSASYGNVGFQNSSGVDVGTLLGKYGTLNCTDTDVDVDIDRDACDSDTDGCFVDGNILTARGLIHVAKIVEGDLLWGTDEQWHEVIGIANGEVGIRGVYRLKNGGVVTSEHIIYQGDGAYTANKALAEECIPLVASNGKKGFYNSPSGLTQIDGAKIEMLPIETQTYSPIVRGGCIAYLNGERVLIASEL